MSAVFSSLGGNQLISLSWRGGKLLWSRRRLLLAIISREEGEAAAAAFQIHYLLSLLLLARGGKGRMEEKVSHGSIN